MTNKKASAIAPAEQPAHRVSVVENSPFRFIAEVQRLTKANYVHDHNDIFTLSHGLCLASFVRDEPVSA